MRLWGGDWAQRADGELFALQTALEEAMESVEHLEADVDLKDGVLNLTIGEHAYVLNKQTPNEQIWWSSPLSGPRRYHLLDEQWTCVRDGQLLRQDLQREMTQLAPDMPSLCIADHQ